MVTESVPAASAWDRVQLARHRDRPHTLDYIRWIASSFLELHGDRTFADDRAMVGGLGQIEDLRVMFIGQQKGRTTRDNVERNFGMPRPEGYRKAMRLMRYAEKFGLPVVTFIDTPGAAADPESEQRGQAWAIADNIALMSQLRTPIVSVITGEGNSGGALGIGIADRLLMMENAFFSVVTPEGCASILWRDAKLAPQAAETMRITALDAERLNILDEVIAEPDEGAHVNGPEAAQRLKDRLVRHLNELLARPVEQLLAERYARYRRVGVFFEGSELRGLSR